MHISRVSPALHPPERPPHTHTQKKQVSEGEGTTLGQQYNVGEKLYKQSVLFDYCCFHLNPGASTVSRSLSMYECMVIKYSKSMDQPGNVTNPAKIKTETDSSE